MQLRLSVNRSALILILFIGSSVACNSKKPVPPKQDSIGVINEADSIGYESLEDKSSVSSLYELDHMKEWYPTRILPPPFDFTIDISGKSITELWLLRNEIFARNGYLFEDAVLRGHFSQFKWYQPVFDVPGFKVQLNKEEQQFVNKVLSRENDLRKERYTTQNGHAMINMDHVYNLMQFKEVPEPLKQQLAKVNFAIVPARHEQLFHGYDQNHYQYIPSYISTDIYLQLLHIHFSSLLRRIEEDNFIPLLKNLLKGTYQESLRTEKINTDDNLKRAAQWTTTYVAIAYSLLTGEPLQVARGFEKAYSTELSRILEGKGVGSEFLNSQLIQYSQFTPRGNYTKTPEMEDFFRCMKWLNTAPMFIDDDNGIRTSLLLASFLKRSPERLKAFQKFSKAIQFIVGDEDNLSITHAMNIISDSQAKDPLLWNDPQELMAIRNKLLAVNPSIINPKSASSDASELDRPTVLFTAGRYTFDSEILINLVHVLRPNSLRPFPTGLDVFAALGSKEAEAILLDENHEADKWSEYPNKLKKIQDRFGQYGEWNKNIYSKTMEVINQLRSSDERYPLYMKTPQWERKNLITSLAAWAELKHDMLLYSEQPVAAQAGEGGGPPPPQHIGYVEPNAAFWKKALELIDLQESTLGNLDLLGKDIKYINQLIRNELNFLLAVSEKELTRQPLTPKEFDELSWIGGSVERLTFRIFDTDHLPEKERLVALVADVYSFNNAYLEEATGLIDELYVVAEINGKPYLTRGTVFSYYEFINPSPLTDEKWQAQLLDGKNPSRPKWNQSTHS